MKAILTCASFALTIATRAPAQTLTSVREIKAPCKVLVVVLAPTGKEVAAGCKGNTLHTFSVADGRPLHTITFGAIEATALGYSADGKRIAVANVKGEARVFNAGTGTSIQTLSPANTVISGVALSPNGRVLAVAPFEKPVQLWDVDHKRLIASLENPFSGSSALVFSPDGTVLASADNDGVVRVYDAGTGRMRARYDALLMDAFSVAFSPDSKQLVVGGADRVVVMIDPFTGRELRRLPKQKDPIGTVIVLADGKTVVASTFNVDHMSEARNMVAWDMSSGKSAIVASGRSFVSGVALADGRLLLANAEGSVVKLWAVR